MRDLTPKQLKFVQHYVDSGNATQSAINAGYATKNAGYTGSQLLKNPKIREAVQKKTSDITDRIEQSTGVTRESVVEELAKIAFLNPIEMFSWGRSDSGTDFIRLVDFDKVPDEVKRCIKSIRDTKEGVAVTFYDKPRALELLARIFGFITDKHEVTGKNGTPLSGEIEHAKIAAKVVELCQQEPKRVFE